MAGWVIPRGSRASARGSVLEASRVYRTRFLGYQLREIMRPPAPRGLIFRDTGETAGSLIIPVKPPVELDSGTPDQNPGQEHEHAAHHDLERRREEGRIHVAVADVADGGQFGRDYRDRDQRGHLEV